MSGRVTPFYEGVTGNFYETGVAGLFRGLRASSDTRSQLPHLRRDFGKLHLIGPLKSKPPLSWNTWRLPRA